MDNDLHYTVIKDKGIVICRLSGCSDIAIDRIFKYTGELCDSELYQLKDCYFGVAKCAPEDEFDAEYGKKLALSRAKIKRNKAITRMIRKYIRNTAIGIKRLADHGIHEID